MLIANVSMSQIEANSHFINERRTAISFLPNDPAVSSFLEVLLFLNFFFLIRVCPEHILYASMLIPLGPVSWMLKVINELLLSPALVGLVLVFVKFCF